MSLEHFRGEPLTERQMRSLEKVRRLARTVNAYVHNQFFTNGRRCYYVSELRQKFNIRKSVWPQVYEMLQRMGCALDVEFVQPCLREKYNDKCGYVLVYKPERGRSCIGGEELSLKGGTTRIRNSTDKIKLLTQIGQITPGEAAQAFQRGLVDRINGGENAPDQLDALKTLLETLEVSDDIVERLAITDA